MALNDKVVLITGAGSGIGKATALLLAEQLASLSLVDINENNLKVTADNCEKFGSKVLNIVADLTDDTEVKKVIDETVTELSKIDVVVNCAGIYRRGRILDSNMIDTFDQIMATNLRSVVVLTSFAVPFLIKTNGCIVNISSVASVMATTGYLTYNISKAALSHFTRSVALELAPKGVRVVNILPGATRTNILLHGGYTPEEDEKSWDQVSKVTPLKKVVQPDEVAELIAFLASDKGRSITGSDFAIDAGMILGGPHK